MKIEIERKYLLKALPKGLSDGQEIRQGYLSVSDPEVRLRQIDGHYFVTQKTGAGLCREESEAEVSEQVFTILWPATQGRRVEKIRHRIAESDGTIWELDDYKGELAGLYTAEVELPAEDCIPRLPGALEDLVIVEVTSDARYKNKQLATQGLPPAR